MQMQVPALGNFRFLYKMLLLSIVFPMSIYFRAIRSD